MNGALPSPHAWSRRRWIIIIGLVFAAHIGLIFVFSDRRPALSRPPTSGTTLGLAENYDELLALNDPTLFALPHRKGFAGTTWLRVPEVTLQPFGWTEPPQYLALPMKELGLSFARLMNTNLQTSFELETSSTPALPVPTEAEPGMEMRTNSTLRLGNGLSGRRLLNPPVLRSWSSPDLLTNNVVQVLVDADGRVMSAIRLSKLPGSGLEETDKEALELARTARFEPLPDQRAGPTLGTMIFEWHSLPPTNAPASTP